MDRDYLPVREWTVHRPRISALLDKGMEHPLVNVTAGQGYGKTLALADYCRTTLSRVVWVRLTRLDNDPGLFWRTFTEAARREMPALAEAMDKMDFPGGAIEFDRFLRALARQLYGGTGVVLVLDSAEAVHNKQVQQVGEGIVEAALEGLCTVLVSNRRLAEQPVLGAGKQFHISARELAFDAEEAEQLYRYYGMAPTAAQVQEALRRTGGWPLALHLQVSDPAPPAAFGDVPQHQIIAELFERNHYANYDEEVRGMLVRLSHFPRMPLGLVKALGARDMEKMLHTLSLDIFVTYDYTGRYHVFQTMYRDFLSQKQAMLEAGEVAKLQARAGSWFLENGWYFDAMDCFWAIRDYGRFLDTVSSLPRKRRGVGSTNLILQRLNSFPEDVRAADDRVDFCRAFMYMNAAQLGKAKELLLALRDRLAARTAPQADGRMLGNICVALADISFAQNTTEGMAWIKMAVPLLPNGCDIRTEELYLVENNDVFLAGQPARAPAGDGAVLYGVRPIRRHGVQRQRGGV